MARIMAIDYGSKRVGLAVTDPLQIIARGLETVHSKDVLDYLKSYCAQEEVELFIVGEPLNLDGSPTDATPMVKGFVRKLKKMFPDIPVRMEDERYTSKLAVQEMVKGGYKKKDRRKKENIDTMAATLLLQNYLEEGTV